MTNLEVLL